MSFVISFIGYKNKVSSLYNKFNQAVLAEEYLDGREFTVAIVKTLDEQLVVSAVEIIPPTTAYGLRILGAQAKKDDSEFIIKILDAQVKDRVTALAIDAFNALGVTDYGRIDIKTDNHGECYFMEANLVPGMTYGSSYFPKACEIANGFSYDKVIELLLTGGIARAESTVPPHLYPGSDEKLVTTL